MNRFIILLTTCVSPRNIKTSFIFNKDGSITDISEERKKLYLHVINEWLNKTNLSIYIVDSSNYDFKEISNKNFHNTKLKIDKVDNSSHAEVESLSFAYKKWRHEWRKKGYTHFIKITGRYYLEDLEKWCNNVETKKCNYDLWKQNIKVENKFHSEIFVCKISKFEYIFRNYEKHKILEEYIYEIIISNKFVTASLPSFKNTLNSRRGGDNALLEYL